MAHEPQPIFLTNTMGHTLEEFSPLHPPQVRMYTCGPTVYSYTHIGNFRAFVFADTVRRMLEYNGYDVAHVRNITDVGHLTNETLGAGLDRIERAAREENKTPWDIARYFSDAFLQDADKLNLLRPQHIPRATEYVPQMIELTQRLIDSGAAYPANGDVYYNVEAFPSYGALSNNTVQDLVAGARVEVGEGKRSPADFALWRGAGPDRIMRWASPWGEGVPGWHIECSAMSMTLLGEELDIHTGAVDNIFPHHEDERAQSEAATGRPFVRFWLHNEWLQLPNDEKMSKSLGNIYTVSDLEGNGIHPLSYRYFTFQANYRTPLSFSWEALAAAQTALYRVWDAAAELHQTVEPGELSDDAERFRTRFHGAINRDLDTPGALAAMHDALGAKLSPQDKLSLLLDFDTVFGLRIKEMAEELSQVDENERGLLQERSEARTRKDWSASDALRDQLTSGGLEVKDTAQGQRWVRRDLLPQARGEAQSGAGEQA